MKNLIRIYAEVILKIKRDKKYGKPYFIMVLESSSGSVTTCYTFEDLQMKVNIVHLYILNNKICSIYIDVQGDPRKSDEFHLSTISKF